MIDKAEGWISEWCNTYLGTDFKSLDLSELLSNPEVRRLYAEAKQASSSRDYKGALELIAQALVDVLLTVPGTPFPVVGKPNTEEALVLAAFGVSASEYLTLQKFLPTAYLAFDAGIGRIVTEWSTRDRGHPANWTAANVEFCLAVFLDVALKIQHAPPVPTAVHFRMVYDDVITPKAGAVDLWKYRSEGKSLLTAFPVKGAVVYTLQPGQHLRCILAPSEVMPELGLEGLKRRRTIDDAPILEVRAREIEGGVAYVERDLVEISFAPQENPFARSFLPPPDAVEPKEPEV